ncbi:hypothetical protein [Paenibacillus sp. OK076]|uniref:hypothetical protein n=1 Tax=Paenibacillus sp. OK076 TaxID=1884379 RepID=UPI0008B6C348|nr:hypothetical protein [Paenibacillus sp. OK076]SEP34658.1 hypothetical protein SAMN05518670_6659 [Paenibacillus sp. OK076]
MSNNVLTAVNRIKQIDWSLKAEVKKSNTYLISEYLRRASVFLIYNSSISSSVFFSPIKVLGIEKELDLEKISENIFPEIDIPSNPITRIICIRYVELSYLLDNGYIPEEKFHDIYEPIIKFIERGGSLRIDKGIYLEGKGFTFLLGDWVQRYSNNEVIDINDTKLDLVDEDDDE